MCDLGDELDWLQSFTKTETEAYAVRFFTSAIVPISIAYPLTLSSCRFEDLRAEMEEVATTVDGQCNILRNEFLALKVDIESFSDVFDNLLTLLEEMTEFLRLGSLFTTTLSNAHSKDMLLKSKE